MPLHKLPIQRLQFRFKIEAAGVPAAPPPHSPSAEDAATISPHSQRLQKIARQPYGMNAQTIQPPQPAPSDHSNNADPSHADLRYSYKLESEFQPRRNSKNGSGQRKKTLVEVFLLLSLQKKKRLLTFNPLSSVIRQRRRAGSRANPANGDQKPRRVYCSPGGNRAGVGRGLASRAWQ